MTRTKIAPGVYRYAKRIGQPLKMPESRGEKTEVRSKKTEDKIQGAKPAGPGASEAREAKAAVPAAGQITHPQPWPRPEIHENLPGFKAAAVPAAGEFVRRFRATLYEYAHFPSVVAVRVRDEGYEACAHIEQLATELAAAEKLSASKAAARERGFVRMVEVNGRAHAKIRAQCSEIAEIRRDARELLKALTTDFTD